MSVGLNNLSGLNANRNTSAAAKQRAAIMEKIASGHRINKAADDPAGLRISEMLRSQLSGFAKALSNTQEASNMMGIAEGGLGSVSSMLQNMRGLAIGALNSGVQGSDATSADQMEMNSSLATISRVVSTTNYAGNNLLDGSAEDLQLQLGEGSGEQDRANMSIGDYSPGNLGTVEYNGETYSINDLYGGGSASLANNPELALKVIDQAISDVSAGRANIGAYQANTLDTNAEYLQVAVENVTRTESAIRDSDLALMMTNYIATELLEKSGLKQVQQANIQSQSVLQLLGMAR